MNEGSEFDIVIIGGGVAGLSAALFAARFGHSTMVIERFAPGGHLVNVESIEDFPGFPNGVPGYELGPLMQEQAAKYGAEFQMAEVESIEAVESYWQVNTAEGIYRAKAVIVATGSHPKDLGVPRERALRGQGVSNCASCDGPLFYRSSGRSCRRRELRPAGSVNPGKPRLSSDLVSRSKNALRSADSPAKSAQPS